MMLPSQSADKDLLDSAAAYGRAKQCDICRGWGHTKMRCPMEVAKQDPQMSVADRLKMICNECGGTGHKVVHHQTPAAQAAVVQTEAVGG